MKLVCFQLAGQVFGVPIRAVKETLPMRPLTRLFLVPPVVAGLINVRGDVVAVLDLARMVGLAHEIPKHEAAIVMLRSQGARAAGRAACGLLVDRMLGVREIDDDALAPPPVTVEVEAAGYLLGVATDGEPPAPLLVLDPARVLDCERLKPYRKQGKAA